MFLNFKSFYFAEGPVTCETVYETECQTSYHLHEVEEDQPKCETQMVGYCLTKSGNRSNTESTKLYYHLINVLKLFCRWKSVGM